MSVYFFHIIQAYLGIVIYFALWNKKISVKDFFIGISAGVIAASVFFKIANDFLLVNELKVASYSLASFLLIFLFFIFLLRIRILKIALISLLTFCFHIYYRVTSYDFKLFSGELLDTLSIISFGFTLLGFSLLILLYLFLKRAALGVSYKITAFFIFIITVLLNLRLLADSALEFMRFGVLGTHEIFLSIVAKLIHYSSFFPYIYSLLTICLIGIYLKALPKLPKKNVVGSITFRKIKALIRNIFSVSKSTF
ncbi:MAG: hypothetical protein LBF13_03610, partial [Campylobacteraceae bacterium]|nr:hypothetical protein [Campylobacteraceae bacterium]